MNEKKHVTLRVLNKIADDILLKNTVKRYNLLHKKGGNKKPWLITAIAAILLVAILTPLLIFWFTSNPATDGKQVPIYKGMTVSSVDSRRVSGEVGYLLDASGTTVPAVTDEPEVTTTPPVTTAPPSNLEPEVEEPVYYATPGEEILISIHLDNPDDFEILSFTLNGTKYASHMFEDGSTLQTLILKVNVGEESGIVEYTIDAIKYVDGEAIKDVRMDGDRTVKVSVAYTTLPSATVSNTVVEHTTFSADVTLADPKGLIEMAGGAAYFRLYFGSELVGEKALSVGENAVSFDELIGEGGYSYRVVAEYDAYDEAGMKEHVVTRGSFNNKPSVTLEITKVDSANLTVTYKLSFANKNLIDSVKVELLQKDQEQPVAVNGDSSQSSFVNLLPKTAYQLRLTYSYDRGDGEGERVLVQSTQYFTSSISIGNVAEGTITKAYSEYNAVFNQTTGDYRIHPGVDITPSGSNTNVYACVNGTVSQIWDDPSMGVCLAITSNEYRFAYKNLERDSITVAVGDTVSIGEVIAQVGNTALTENAEAAHLHFEVTYNGELIDPESLFSD